MTDNNRYSHRQQHQQHWYKKMVLALVLCCTFIILITITNTAPAQKQSNDLDDIAKQLKQNDPAKTGLPPANASKANTPVSAQQAKLKKQLRPEGTIIISRVGRMVRSDVGGEWMFTFDSDSSGKLDPPMIMMPCRLLERMERLIEEDGDQVKFIVSGQIYEYYNRNYLMPTVMSVPYKRDNLSP